MTARPRSFTFSTAQLRWLAGITCSPLTGRARVTRWSAQGLVLRPDWEAVITPVVDYALTRPDVDPARIALIGLSLGGYLAPRAAAGRAPAGRLHCRLRLL